MSVVWAPVQYGWGAVYWLQVEGVPVVWIERETALALPAGYTQDGSLVIDRSSEVGQLVDRESGLGAGFPLTWQLLDTVVARIWFKRASLLASLSQSVAWNDATIHVDDVTGWAAGGGVFWLGLERVTYAATVGGGDPRFTGCTRGTAGSLASEHRAGEVGGVCTDLPRWWRGRQVRLFASPCTPSGTITGASLLAEADEIWRGVLDVGPDRLGGLWELQAQSLDRRLDLRLAAPVTGKVLDTVTRFPVEPGLSFQVHIVGWSNVAPPPVKLWDFVISVEPFAAYASGDLLTAAEQADAIKVEWVAALPLAIDLVTGLPGAGAYLGALVVGGKGPPWLWSLALVAGAVPVPGLIAHTIGFNQESVPPEKTHIIEYYIAIGGGMGQWLSWASNGDQINGAFTPGTPGPAAFAGVAVELDAPVAVLPQWGVLKIDGKVVNFAKSAVQGKTAFFSKLYTVPGKPFVAVLKAGAEVELVYTDGGQAADVLRDLLCSSGTGQLGTFDVLPLGQGYGLDGAAATSTSAVEVASFAKLAQGPLVALPVEARFGGATLAEVFGGLLSLGQRGIVTRGDDLSGSRRQRLQLVSTEPGGSAWVASVADEHLLTTDAEPVEAVRKRDVANTLRLSTPAGSVMVQDLAAAAHQGEVAREVAVPFFGKVTDEQASQWALSLFIPAQTEQAIEVRLVPWLDLDVGDLVKLVLTHHAIWQWSTGTPGYDGFGRVLGIKRELKSGAVTATILIDGGPVKRGLCPSLQVDSWTGPAGAPVTITVPRRFYPHLVQALSLLSPMRLLHLESGLGAEGAGGGYTCSAVVDTGTAAQLTVAAVLGGAVLSAASWLTLPELATASDYQAAFCHEGDGSVWG